MDLRRFLVFFVLVLFLFSINIYSASIFDIENITSLPSGTEDNDYIIGYDSLNKNVFIAVCSSGYEVKSFHVTENGVYNEKGTLLKMFYWTYKPDENRWSSVAIIDYENATWLTEQGLKPLYSNKDVYRNGQNYVFRRKYDGNLGILNNLTSDVIFSNLIKPFLYLMPLILIFIVLVLTFLKAWNFIKGVF